MATTVRSIGAMPFQGGQFTSNKDGHAMVRLSNSRMIWSYYQTGPNWLAASVIDVPGGITGTGTATLTNQQLLMPMSQDGFMQLGKINQTTFLMITGSRTGNMTWYVFEVDAQGVFTRVDMGTFGYGTTTSGVAVTGFGQVTFKILELKDNLVMVTGLNQNSSTTTVLTGFKGAYNTTTKTMAWDGTVTNLLTIQNTSNVNSFELIVRPIPGRDLTMLQTRYYSANVLDLRGTSGVVINNQTGAVQVAQIKLPLNTFAASAGTFSDMVPLPGDRIAYLTTNYSIAWASVDYTAGSFLSLGSNQFTSVLGADNLGRHLLPLTADYVLMMQRQPLLTPTTNAHRFKVIRRVDQNMSEQSAASAQNSNAGFGLNATPTTIAAFQQNYPEFIDGKVVWFGLDSASAPTKFSWTVVSLDA